MASLGAVFHSPHPVRGAEAFSFPPEFGVSAIGKAPWLA
jgi:hypothetical protein